MDHGIYNMEFGTWRTERDWNMDNRTRLEHRQQKKIGRRRLKQGSGLGLEYGYQNRFGTWRTFLTSFKFATLTTLL